VDLVSHSGNSGAGDFAQTLNVTDIHSTWTESRALLGRSEEAVTRALNQIEPMLPFPLLGVDSDNGSEFINWHLKSWCERRKIQLTRGRPYKKDDNAHVEQKNWTHVRKLLGWERYDTHEVVEAMNDLYRQELRLWMNLFLPSVKLVKKVRVGSKLRRVYDAPQTPLERVQASGGGDGAKLAELKRLQETLDPFALSRAIQRKLERVYKMANRRLSPRREDSREQKNKAEKRAGRPGGGKDGPASRTLEIAARFPLSHRPNNKASVTLQMARHGSLRLHS